MQNRPFCIQTLRKPATCMQIRPFCIHIRQIQRYFSPEIEVISLGPEGRLCDLVITSGFESVVAPGFEDGGELV